MLDFEQAWKQVKLDAKYEAFIRTPYEMNIVEQDTHGWFVLLKSQFKDNKYQPGPLTVCDVPKDNGQIRPAGHLSVNDRIIYTALLLACYPQIRQTVQWSQGLIDFAYQLNEENLDYWSKHPFLCWKEFRELSISTLSPEINYVVVADICGFYENIDIGTLVSDLRQAGVNDLIVKQIRANLSRWSQDNGVADKGIPQGHIASHLLAKLYLNSVDHALHDLGFQHCHYSDDYRIFCRNLPEAKKALIELSKILRRRGLNIQAKKSAIIPANDARIDFNGIDSIIRSVRSKYIAEIMNKFSFSEASIPFQLADQLLTDSVEEVPIVVIREAYNEYFLTDNRPFHKTLFHFLLRRLGNAKDKFALEHTKDLFISHPQETETILEYYSKINVADQCEYAIQEFLECGFAVYHYQIYLMIEWLNLQSKGPSNQVIKHIRKLAFDFSIPSYLRSECRTFLSMFGSISDLEKFMYISKHSLPN